MKKKILYFILAIIQAYCFAGDNVPLSQILPPPSDTAGFTQSKTGIQQNYNEMYMSLPCEQRHRIQSAAASIENLRLKSPQDAQTFLSIQRDRAELSMKTTVSQMVVADAVKTQIENSRREIFLRINEKILEMKVRRSAHR
jgi:hypothetical protein